MVYQLLLTQHGTFWWHADNRAQTVKGLRGPFIIDPLTPEIYAGQYDHEHVFMLTGKQQT